MLEHRIHHLVVDEDGWALGVISESDLVAAISVGPLFLARRISVAATIEHLAESRAAMVQMVRALVESGVSGYHLGRITAETTDRQVRRALLMVESELGPRHCLDDDGVGIPPDQVGTIFEGFRQVGDPLTAKPEGGGLGLPISRDIVHQHDSTLTVRSNVGRGSCFRMTMPVAAWGSGVGRLGTEGADRQRPLIPDSNAEE
jgi:hypothetical protein